MMSEVEFFIVCQPGFEKQLALELGEFWPYLLEKDARPHHRRLQIVDVQVGGVTVMAELVLGLQINFFSKIASRVLMRIAQFKSRDFPGLFKNLKKLNLQPYFPEQFRLEVQASSSRLNNEKRIVGVAEECWQKKLNDKASPALFIRMHEDICTVSVDTSGEHLHFRRGKKKIGEAPLRETISAFMLHQLIGGSGVGELQALSLLDPMAGSGTLLSEAAFLFQPNFFRSYSFLEFPSCPKLLKAEKLQQNYPNFPRLFRQFYAFDSAVEMLPVLRENLAGLPVEIEARDIFSGARKIDEAFWLVSNPPYGERLKVDWNFTELARAFERYRPSRMGVLLPQRAVGAFEKGLSKKIKSVHHFKNGGIPVSFVVV
jgi:putative N6-adenine-specific DNA methylase